MVTIPANDVGPRTEVLMSASNDGLLLQIDDERNIYRGKPLEIHVPDGAFSARTRAGGLPWLQQLYTWLLGARACQLVVAHDDYRFQQADAARGARRVPGGYGQGRGQVGAAGRHPGREAGAGR